MPDGGKAMNILKKFLTGSNKGCWILVGISSLGLILTVFWGFCMGANPISIFTFFSVLLYGTCDPPLYQIITIVRMPRVMAALLAGSGLAVSGAIIQSVLNNPMASPNIIGINSGAGFFVLLVSVWQNTDPFLRSFSAFTGAMLAAFIILFIGMKSRMSRLLLVLTGFVINSLFGAGMNAVLIFSPDSYVGAGNYLVGGLSAVTADTLLIPGVFILTGILAAMFSSRGLNLLGLGSDRAKTLGMNVLVCKCMYLFIAAVLAGAAVSFAGLIGFVGLLIPHIVKLLIGQDHRFVIPVSAFFGGIFVILCDLFARTLFLPYELPVGILMSIIGSPFFLYLILKNKQKD